MSPRQARDINRLVADHLRDMALIHSLPHGRIAYKRAAQAIVCLDVPLDEVLTRCAPCDIRCIGHASERMARRRRAIILTPRHLP